MRISDWSSDVCSSDLQPVEGLYLLAPRKEEGCSTHDIGQRQLGVIVGCGAGDAGTVCWIAVAAAADLVGDAQVLDGRTFVVCLEASHQDIANGFVRSEEHTSELQSLMRISYAVFCLKKKNKQHRR